MAGTNGLGSSWWAFDAISFVFGATEITAAFFCLCCWMGDCSGGDVDGFPGGLGCWLADGGLNQNRWGRSVVVVHEMNNDWVAVGTGGWDGMFFLLIHTVIGNGWRLVAVKYVEEV